MGFICCTGNCNAALWGNQTIATMKNKNQPEGVFQWNFILLAKLTCQLASVTSLLGLIPRNKSCNLAQHGSI